MTSNRTVNLLRCLFVIFAGFVGVSVGPALCNSGWIGAGIGLCFGLVVVLADRLLKGITLRTFSSATFGLLWRINVCDVLPFGIVRRQPPSAMLTKTKHHAEVISTKRRVSALNARRNLSFLFWALHVLGWFRWRRAFGFVTGPMTFS